MSKHKGKSIKEILSLLSNPQREILAKLRLTVKKTLPEAVETVKWGNITYLLDGKNLAWIIFYSGHVDFGFFKGAELDSNLLEGTGKSLRHIKILDNHDVPEAEITRLLKEAAKLAGS
jgi:hypothetical protein